MTIVALLSLMVGFLINNAVHSAQEDTRIQIKGPLNDQTRSDVGMLKEKSATSDARITDLERQSERVSEVEKHVNQIDVNVARIDGKLDSLFERLDRNSK